MGTDIHGIFQAKMDGKWIDIPHKWEEHRHYFLFAWLAGVRNGFGFAGVPTHEPIEPIAERRGLPDDFIVDANYEHPTTPDAYDSRRAQYIDESDRGYWMGDHSHSWLTADEILTAKRPCGTRRTGCVDRKWFESWDGKTPPQSWSGSIVGPGIVTSLPGNITDETTHVQIEWNAPEDGLDYFVDEVRRLRDEHGDVRLVFGFDS